MLGWFFPRCPVGTQDKVWVERRMLWLVERFGLDRLKNATAILPTREYFPEPYEGNEDSARICFDRICQYMQIDKDSVRLEIVDDELMPGSAGLYLQRTKSNVLIARSQLGQPPRLLATIAHELAHELLLKGGHLSAETQDHEFVTDLLPVFLGLGIFAANATLVSKSWSEGQMEYSQFSKQGYLSSIVLGYALSAFAFLREEKKPHWATHLRTDARVSLHQGLRYLYRTGDTILTDTAHAFTTAELIERLGHRSATFRLASLWTVTELVLPDDELFTPVCRCLNDSDCEVQAVAITALGSFGARAHRAIPDILNASWNGKRALRVVSIETLGMMTSESAEIVPGLMVNLKSTEPEIVSASAAALGRFGIAAESAVPQLFASLEHWASVNEDDVVVQIVATVRAIRPDAGKLIGSYFERRDADVRRHVMRVLREQGG